MKKEARKSSNDLVQEKLREDKAVLNKKITLFINDLIHLKKMMNGWNSKFFNQKSKINDPIPADPATIIGSLARDYSEIAKEQLKVVNDQINYSKNRRKKQINTNPDQLSLFQKASNDYDLISNSSNPISRFFARLLNPGIGFGEAARIRRYRNSLLTASIDLYRNIENFQGLIMGVSAESIFSASKFLIKIENQWNFLRQGFLTYRLNMPENVLNTGGEIVVNERKELNKESPKDNIDSKDSNKESEDSLILEEADKAVKDFRSNIDNFMDLNKKELNTLIMKYVSATDDEKEKLAPEVLKMYKELLYSANKKNNVNESSLENIFKIKNKFAMQKLAKSFLKRYFGKAYHQLNPLDKTSAFRLDLYNLSEECLEELDKVMDSLEKTMDVEDLNTHLTKININMIKIRELISVLDSTIRGVSFDKPFMNMLDKKEILEYNTNLSDKQREQLSRVIDQRQIRDISNFYLNRNK